jgi:hypothetical protein
MRIAVVTPYSREEPRVVARCIKTVKAQTVPCEHYLVADGRPLKGMEADPTLRHLVLPFAHGDGGNVARTVGGLAAAAAGCDAVAYLDVDNGYLPNHLESLQTLLASTGLPLAASWRSFHRPDGSLLKVISKEEQNGHHVDTSCWLIARDAFDLLDAWLMPTPLGPVCDRVFFEIVKFRGHAFASSRQRTVCYTTLYRSHYEMAKEELPPNVKFGALDAASAWLKQRENRDATIAAIGFSPKLQVGAS